VVEPTPLKNMTSSVGMIIPKLWKNKIHVPNHQPDKDWSLCWELRGTTLDMDGLEPIFISPS
jgi:hypothetical protein